MTVLLVLALAVPAALALAWLPRAGRRLAVSLAPLAALPALALGLAPAVAPELSLPGVFTGLRFGVDPLGRAFLIFTAALWLAAGLFARSYMAADPRRPAFFGLFLLTLTGNLMLVLARDMLSFYLGFAAMTFAAYGLVVHARGPAEFRAGRIYIIMAVAAEACLLAGLVFAAALAATTGFEALPAAYARAPSPSLLAGLFLVGFAVKAGLVPLHVWLPLAHPVAPTPASALLSGVMIKAGLLGWLRFLPVGELALPGWGTALIAAGLAASFFGVVVGFTQDEPKTVLAYSSVSQMGFMAVGVGIALGSPAVVPAALVAISHYAAHHAVAKGALFLGTGVAPVLGAPGLWRLAAYAGAVFPALALAGAPFTSGAAAKQALKLAGESLPAPWPSVLALLLGLAAVGTTLLLARFLAVLPRAGVSPAGEAPPAGRWAPWAGLVLLSLTASAWLAWIYAPPPDVLVPAPIYGVVDSLWPVAVGTLLAASLWRFAQRLPHPLRIPAGDLVEAAAAAGRGLERLWHGAAPVRALLDRLAPLAAAAHHRARWLATHAARADTRLTRGVVLGAVLFLLLAALGAALIGA